MQPEPAKPVDETWLARCAHRLRQRWPHADLASLEEAAAELWTVEALRVLDGEEAAARWLAPLRRPARYGEA